MEMTGGGELDRVPMIISLVLFKLIFMWLRSDHSATLATYNCMALGWPFRTTSDRVVSSKNLCIRHSADKSLISFMNINGPSHAPRGMPPDRVIQSENMSDILTLWCLSKRNEDIHRVRTVGTVPTHRWPRSVALIL
jgi:hypothetical protein